MVWAIVVVAIAVLGVAAWAGTGRLGEMPEPISDRRKAFIPEGPVDAAFIEALSLPVASTGYRRSQVDAYLGAHVMDDGDVPKTCFDVVPHGYDMQAVDVVLDRMRLEPAKSRDVAHAEVVTEHVTAQPLAEQDPMQPARAHTGVTGEDITARHARNDADPVHHIVAPDDESAPVVEPSPATSRDLPAV